MDSDITGLVAVILIFGLPIVLVIMYFLNMIKKNRELTTLKSEIVRAGLDTGTIKELLKSEAGKKEQGKGRINYGTLRAACCLIGLGVGALCGYPFFGTAFHRNPVFLIVAAITGAGIGLLVAFIAEWKLRRKMQDNAAPAADEAQADETDKEEESEP
jgi:F0F1-type ATP synthase assembly protein I